MKGEDWPILAYADQLAVAPGGTLRVMVSTDLPDYSASVVRLGGARPETTAVVGSGTYLGRKQQIYAGSYVFVPHSPLFDHLRALTVHAWIWPTMAAAGRRQGLVSHWSSPARSGWGLYLDEAGRLLFRRQAGQEGAREYSSDRPLQPHRWYQVTCSFDDGEGKVRLTQQALGPWADEPHTVAVVEPPREERGWTSDAPLLIGAGAWRREPQPHAAELFEGKIDNPAVFKAMLDEGALARLREGAPPTEIAPEDLLGAWDFSIGISSADVADISRNRLNGTAVNMPTRAVTGHTWCRTEQCFTRAPHQYAAIHFHSDDLSDAGWQADVELQIPPELGSGAYAVHLASTSAREADDVPFFVLPRPSSRAQLAYLVPTFTYLAYGNKHVRAGEGPHKAPTPADLFLARHPEVGLSLYDRHFDGSGCCYASRLRPIVNLRPDQRARPRHFPADLLFLQWLERKGYPYDVITDEVLHAEGRQALADYRVVVAGSHPEYVTSTMLEALQSFVSGGGKLMYLGGNGFYWVTSTDPAKPGIMEVRRGVAGTRDWSSEPGELYHSTTGEFGGLWRNRGWSPNHLVGIGMSATGGVGPVGAGYVRQAGSFRDEVSFIFRGLTDDEVIGDFAPMGVGAAGDEVDRMDADLGTPASTIQLASSRLNASYLITIEDLGMTTPNQDATRNPRVRADMVYLSNARGGEVFSVGSINWFRSLGYRGDDNNVSRVTENVLRHFLGMEELECF